MRIYEHKNAMYSVHGRDTEVAGRVGLEDLRAPEFISSGVPGSGAASAGSAPLSTLPMQYRVCKQLVVLLLQEAGKKIVLLLRNGTSVSIKASGSPGALGTLEAEFFESEDAFTDAAGRGDSGGGGGGGVLAIRLSNNGQLGLAHWDTATRTLAVTSLHHGDSSCLDELEGALVSTGAKELLLCAGDALPCDASKLDDTLNELGVAKTERKRPEFDAEDIDRDIGLLVGDGRRRGNAAPRVGAGGVNPALHAVPFLDQPLARSAAAAVVRFCNLLSGTAGLEGRACLAALDGNSTLRMDSAALRALNILPDGRSGGGGKKGSLLGVLDRTSTSMGGRLLRRWLAQPLQDAAAIDGRLCTVGVLLDDAAVRGSIRDEHLRKLPDIHRLARKFTRRNRSGVLAASLQDVVILYQCSKRLPELARALASGGDAVLEARFVTPLRALLEEAENFEALVETTIDLDQVNNHEFVISPTVDVGLAALREKKDGVMSGIADVHAQVEGELRTKADQLKLERKDNLGYFFRLTRRDEKLIRAKPAYVVLETRKDGVRFTCRALRKLSDEYTDLMAEYESLQSELRTKTLEIAATYAPVFEDLSALLADLDVLASFATVAAEAPQDYCKPSIGAPASGFVLRKARHPVVEENLDGRPFISNDIDLRRGFSDVPAMDDAMDVESSADGGALVVITGPVCFAACAARGWRCPSGAAPCFLSLFFCVTCCVCGLSCDRRLTGLWVRFFWLCGCCAPVCSFSCRTCPVRAPSSAWPVC